MSDSTAQRLALVRVWALAGRLLVGGALAGCGGAELPPPAEPGPLRGCSLAEESNARTWECGEVIALELAVEPATEPEIRAVLDEFALGFLGSKAARTDLAWARGAESFPSVRMEGTTPDGKRFVAQMIVVTRPDDPRVVQCASRNPVAPCEPILQHLVGAP